VLFLVSICEEEPDGKEVAIEEVVEEEKGDPNAKASSKAAKPVPKKKPTAGSKAIKPAPKEKPRKEEPKPILVDRSQPLPTLSRECMVQITQTIHEECKWDLRDFGQALYDLHFWALGEAARLEHESPDLGDMDVEELLIQRVSEEHERMAAERAEASKDRNHTKSLKVPERKTQFKSTAAGAQQAKDDRKEAQIVKQKKSRAEAAKKARLAAPGQKAAEGGKAKEAAANDGKPEAKTEGPGFIPM
jgi:hypothetical protein